MPCKGQGCLQRILGDCPLTIGHYPMKMLDKKMKTEYFSFPVRTRVCGNLHDLTMASLFHGEEGAFFVAWSRAAFNEDRAGMAETIDGS